MWCFPNASRNQERWVTASPRGIPTAVSVTSSGGSKIWFLQRNCPHSSVSKESACNAGDLGSISGLGRSPGEGKGNPLQYSCLKNPMDRGACQATVFGVTVVEHNWVTKYTHKEIVTHTHTHTPILYFQLPARLVYIDVTSNSVKFKMKLLVFFQNLIFLLGFSSLRYCFPKMETKLISLPRASPFSGPSSTWSLFLKLSVSLPDASSPQYSHKALCWNMPDLCKSPTLAQAGPAPGYVLTQPLRAQLAPPWSSCQKHYFSSSSVLLTTLVLVLPPVQLSAPMSSQWIPGSQASLLTQLSDSALCPQSCSTENRFWRKGPQMTYVHPTMIMPTCHRRDIIHLKISSGPGSKEIDIHTVENDRTRKKSNLAPKLRT